MAESVEPEVALTDDEKSNAAAAQIQRIARGKADRARVQELKEKKRAFEAQLAKHTGWGFDQIRNVMLCNAKTKEIPRLITADQQFPMNPEVAETVVESYTGGMDANGLSDGEGTATFKNGHSYKGMWSQGLMHGNGVFTWKDGVCYKGPMVSGRICGRGQLKWPGGNAYDGHVVDGFRHGNGKFVMVMESEEVEDESAVITYEGEWKNGKRNGEGLLMYDSDGKQKYEGEWCNDARHGFGTMTYKSGNIYKGQWQDGKLHGEGQMMWYQKNEVYIGSWRNGLQHGKGEHVWFMEVQSGTSFQTMNRYVGDWVDGKRHGLGSFDFADGSSYEGEWVDNVKEGQGTFTFPDGSCYKGKFAGDKMLGQHKRSSKPTTNPGAGEVVLHINDLLADHEFPDGELIKVKNLLVQYMSELKQIFRYYSQPAASDDRVTVKAIGGQRVGTPSSASLIRLSEKQEGVLIENAFSMSMLDFWKFAKDCRLPDPRLPLAEIDRVFMRVEQGGGGRGGGAESVHSPLKRFVFRQFLEGLVRLADIKYRDLAGTSERLWHVLYQNVLPHACHDAEDEFRARLDAPEARHVIEAYDPHVRGLFRGRCGGGGQQTTTLRACIEVLRERGVVGPGERVTHIDVMDCYFRWMNVDAAWLPANRTNLDVEVIEDEFSELVQRLADRPGAATQAGNLKQPSAPGPAAMSGRLRELYARMFPGVEVPEKPKPKAVKKPSISQRRLSRESHES